MAPIFSVELEEIIMTFTDILKITAKSSPVPTIVTIIVAITFSKILDKNISDTVIITVLLLTFLIVFLLLFFSNLSKTKLNKNQSTEKKPVNSGNSISKISTGSGDVFIGNKNIKNKDETFSNNDIKDIKTISGDVFIGNKK
jgi:hypothetical protein